MTDEIITRLGTPDDVHEIMALAEAVASENAPVAINVSKIFQFGIWPSLNKEGGLVGVVGPRGGGVQGFVLLRVGQPWYSDERIIEEFGVYVHPDYRAAKQAAPTGEQRASGSSPGRAAMLYRFCRDVADRMELKLFVGVMSQHRQKSKLRYYERFFGPQAGGYFVYDPRAATALAADD